MQLASNPKIILRYKAGVSQEALRILLALSPFWGIWSLAMAVWALFGLSSAVDEDLRNLMLFVVVLLPCLTLLSLYAIFVCLQNKFEIDSEGIKFPLWTLFQLKGKSKIAWSEIAAVEFVRVSGRTVFVSEQPDHLKIIFADGRTLLLALNSFASSDFQSFVFALQSYAPALSFTPALSELKTEIASSSRAQQALSFTQIWEDDMSSRFASTAFVPLEAGTKLNNDRFEVIGQIAFGGLSAIYLARSKGGICVLKEAVIPLNSNEASKEKAMELFAREAKILMGLEHPRIAGVRDYFIEQGHHYLALEYIDGIDLRRYVRERGPQSEAVVLRWASEIAQILAYLHGLNPAIIHRDITPDNLMLDENGNIVLIDFGAANEMIGAATGTLIGKQAYISPEQFRGKATTSSDLYSLGACLHFLLTGSDPEALSQSHPAKMTGSISGEMNALVSKLTEMNSEKRYSSAEEVQSTCKQILQRASTIKLVEAENVLH